MTTPLVALQMDPLSQISVETDTTVALGLEAQNRGCHLFVYPPDALSYVNGKIMARGHEVTLQDQPQNFYTLGPETLLDLSEASIVLMRQDPPFNMAYCAATHFLELLPTGTQVINDPGGVRNAPEKLLVTQFPDLMPPTIMTWNRDVIDDFIAIHKSVILKPLFEFGGNGIVLLQAGDPNLSGILEIYRRLYLEPPIFQRYLPEVTEGDKRIILIQGEPKGIFKRIPSQGNTRSNMRMGGQAGACEFSTRDREICDRIGPVLRDKGLYLAGIDVIGDYLTEINVTSPTGIRTIKKLYNIDLTKDFWDGVL